MSYVSPPTVPGLSFPPSSTLNAYKAALDWLAGGTSGSRPSFSVHMAAAKSVPNNSTAVVAFDTVDWDTDSGYNTTTGLYTAAQAGLYLFRANVFFASNATNIRRGYLSSTGSPGSGRGPDISAAVDNLGEANPGMLTFLTVGQTAQVNMFQNSGGALNAGTGPNMSFSGVMLSL